MRSYYSPDLELKIYRAKVHSVGKVGDDRLQVRIMPVMADYPSTDVANLPKYPCMFKGQVVNCWTEENPNPDNNEPDWVFVAATDDFTVGYVIGLANQFYTCESSSSFRDSYAFKYVLNFISTRGLSTEHVRYEELVVEHWCNTTDEKEGQGGGFVEMYNHRTGEKYIIMSSGTCFIMQYDNIYMRVGNPSGNTSSDTESFSLMKMDNTEISFKTKMFNVDAENVVLGHHGLSVVGTTGSLGVSMEGVDLQPVSKITI